MNKIILGLNVHKILVDWFGKISYSNMKQITITTVLNEATRVSTVSHIISVFNIFNPLRNFLSSLEFTRYKICSYVFIVHKYLSCFSTKCFSQNYRILRENKTKFNLLHSFNIS